MPRTYPIIQLGDITFSDADVREAKLIEDFNPLCITLPINTLELLLYSEEADFSILNPTGDYARLARRTPMLVYEMIGTSQVSIGRYYLDKWENVSDTLIKFTCVDDMGILDGLTYKGGIWLTPITMGDLLEEVFGETNTPYQLDPNLTDVEITGWIPICSYREAIQQIAFACSAYVLCARQDGVIKVGSAETVGVPTKGIRSGVPSTGQSRVWQKRWRKSQWDGVDPTYTITLAEQAVGTPVNLRMQVTGVEVSMHDIVVGDGIKKLFEGTLAIGDYEINFGQPMHTLAVTGATISESGANYAMLSVTSAGDVLLTGQVYVDTITKYGVYADDVADTKENVLKIDNASLVNSNNGVTIAETVYNYYQERHTIKPKLFVPYIVPGSSVIVDALYGRQIGGIVETMNIDLANGFTADATIVGILEEVV